MKQKSPLELVHAWHEALNDLNVERVLALSDPNVEIVGPRGSAHGLDMLEDWLTRAGLSLHVQRSFQNGEAVVVAEHGVWRNVETNALVDEKDVATHFKVEDGRVAYLARYDDLATALDKAGLSESDEVM